MFKICALLTALAIYLFAVRAGEDVPVEKLPEIVVKTIHTEYPDAKLLKSEL